MTDASARTATKLLSGMFLAGAAAFGGAAQPPASALERAAYAAADEAVPKPDRFEPASFRYDGEAPPPDAEFELLNIDGPNQSGVVRVTFAVLSDQAPREIWTAVRGTVLGPALVSTRTLNRGETIEADDFERVEVDLTRLLGTPLRDPALLAGMVPVRTLGAGRVLTTDLLQPLAVVRRNQAVRLEFVRPGFSISATGTALADGAPGETITAVNTATGARVLCEVQGDGSLHVIRSAGGGVRR